MRLPSRRSQRRAAGERSIRISTRFRQSRSTGRACRAHVGRSSLAYDKRCWQPVQCRASYRCRPWRALRLSPTSRCAGHPRASQTETASPLSVWLHRLELRPPRASSAPRSRHRGQPRILMRGVPAEIAEIIHKAHEATVNILTRPRHRGDRRRWREVRITLAGGQEDRSRPRRNRHWRRAGDRLAAEAGLAIDKRHRVDGELALAIPTFCRRRLLLVPLQFMRKARAARSLAATRRSRARWRRKHAGDAGEPIGRAWFCRINMPTLQISGLSDDGPASCAAPRRSAPSSCSIWQGRRLVAASGIGTGNAVGPRH